MELPKKKIARAENSTNYQLLVTVAGDSPHLVISTRSGDPQEDSSLPGRIAS